MMDEYLFLVLVLLIRFCVPKELDHCKTFSRKAEDGREMRFDLNRFSGLYSIELIDGDFQHRDPPKSVTILFNLCETLVNSNKICNSTGQACLYFTHSKEVYQINEEDSINFKSGSWDTLEFDLVGPTCKSNVKEKFIYHFHIVCKPYSKEPVWFKPWGEWEGLKSCEVHIYWPLSEFCGIPGGDPPCLVHVRHNDSINLSPLKARTFWTAHDSLNHKIYQLNICGPIQMGACNSSAYLCEIDETTKKTTVLADTFDTFYNHHSGIVISYSKKDKVKAEISLQCVSGNQDFHGPIVSYKGNSRKKHKLFVMETPVACSVPPSLCIAIDAETGYQYNLYSLAGALLEFSYGRSKIQISVCGTIQSKYQKDVPCSGPGFASCQVVNDTVVRVMGMQGPSPEVTSDGSVRIIYPDGDPCSFEMPGQRFRTVLDLHCDNIPHQSKIIEEGCVMKVKYSTPLACPTRDINVLGKMCKVTDPLTNHTIDLTVLRNTTSDFGVPFNSIHPSIRFNVCGNLLKPCNGVINTSVCLLRDGREYAIGGPAFIAKYNDAAIKFELYGQSCENGTDYCKVTIIVVCDSRNSVSNSIPMHYSPGQGGHFYVLWKHKGVCLPSAKRWYKCSVQNPKTGTWMGLPSMGSYSANFKIPVMTASLNAYAYLDICNPTLSSGSSLCRGYAEICLIIGPEKAVSLGEIGGVGPFPKAVDEKKIQVFLTNGDLCEQGARGERYSSAINFMCQNAHESPEPMFLPNASTPCHIEFLWKIPQACSHALDPGSGLPEEVSEGDEADCRVVNPSTNHVYDFNSLRSKIWNLSGTSTDDAKNVSFYLSVCSPLPQEQLGYCGFNAGACMEKDFLKYNVGLFTKRVLYHERQLLIRYENGRSCDELEYFNSEILFLCANDFFPRSGPQFVGRFGCKFSFVFYTELACEKKLVSCDVDTTIYGEGIDLPLISLMQSTAAYRVESPDGWTFLLNVCNPLPRSKKLACADGVAACLLQSEGRMESTPVSLGFPHSRPILEHLPGHRKPQVVWKYTGGDLCPGGGSSSNGSSSPINASASIRFICDPNVGPGRPRFEGRTEKECVFNFSWNTSVVCVEDKVDFDRKKCLLTNHATKETFNLTDFYSGNTLKDMLRGRKPPLTGENLFVYLCSWPQDWMNMTNTQECKDTAVCARVGNGQWFKGFGYQHFPYYDSLNNTLKIFFRGTFRDTCSDREVSGAEIWFPCAADRRRHKPKLLAATECHVVIEWPHAMFCSPGLTSSEEAPETSGTGMRTAWKTMAVLMAIALSGSVFLYMVLKTNCWPLVRGRVNRVFGYKHSSLVTYTADPQEEWTEFETLNG